MGVTTKQATNRGRASLRQRVGAVLAAALAGSAALLTAGTPVHAALSCGLDELDQNVFMVNDGLWSNPANWSRNHLPASGEAVCVPGGVVARVSSASTALLGAQDGYHTTLRVEGTVRIESGTTVSLASAVYGGSNLFNGGVIQVLSNSTFDMNADQNGAPAFQNVVGGSLIQVAGGSRILLRRPFLNTGVINLTGGGEMVLDSAASAYNGNGSVIGGQLRMRAGTVTYEGSGSLAVLATGGSIRGTLASSQSLDVACETFSGGIDISQGLTNHGAIHFLPALAGECSVSYTLPVGATLTNHGSLTFGNAGVSHNYAAFSSNFYNRDGLIVNGPTGTITAHDHWSNLEQVDNAGTIRIAPGGFMQTPYNKLVNSGTLINEDRCNLREIDNSGGTIELRAACGVTTSVTSTAASTLRPHWTPSELAKLTVGTATVLGGTLDVVTDGAPPAAGTTRELISGPFSGTFASVTSQPATTGYQAVYRPADGKVDLSAAATVTPPPIDALVPARLLDTRPGATTVDGAGQGAGLQGPGATIELVVAGRGGVPADASAVVLNVTVTQAQNPGYVTVFPCGAPRPLASSLNFVAGSTVPNNVIAKVGVDGKVCVYASAGTHVLADVTGYFAAASPYQPLVPARLLDTRAGTSTVDGAGLGAGLQGAGSTIEVLAGGRGGVPTDAAAVVLNVTVTQAQNPGFVTVFPCGAPRPLASSLNFVTGSTVANGVIAKLGDGGKVCLYASAGTHLVADVNGYFPAGSGFSAIAPARLLDSRAAGTTVDGAGQGAGPSAPGSVVEVPVVGRAGVPANATAVVLNVTVTQAQDPGFVTVFPCGAPRPLASNLNFVAGSTVPNGVIAKVGDGGKVCLFASAGTHLVADLNGWFSGLTVQ